MWSLPIGYRTRKVGEKIHETVGNVIETDFFEMPDTKGVVIKALVGIKIEQPVKRGVNVESKNDGILWVDFKYEKIPQFYYYHDMIRHHERSCERGF